MATNESELTGTRADILIVDDTLANLKLLSELLKRRGYKVRAVPSGSMALMAVETAAPDLILLDIKMPDMDGYQVCERLKKMPSVNELPIIFISALEDTLDKMKAFAMGAVDYVGKPFQEEEVLARVENHIMLSRLRQQLAQRNQELEQSLKTLQENQAKVLELQRREVLAEERERTMRDMHDGIGGLLVSTLAMLEAGETDLNKIEDALRAALEDLRLMIDSLDPLDEDQLVLALGMFRARMLPRLHACGLRVDWEVTDLPAVNDFGPNKLLQIMRILQEAITNVIKHARATCLVFRSRFELTPAGVSCLFIELSDNGIGWSGAPREGRGVSNMRRRAEAIGADLDISDTENGVRLRLCLPCQQS